MAETTGQRHIRIYEAAKSARASLEQYWQDLVYYAMPRKAYINRIYTPGDRLPTDIYNSTAVLSNAYFAAGMQAYMSGPQTKWFTLGLKNKNLLEQKHIRTYLRDAEDVLYSMINGSNFYQEDVEGYLGLGSIGTDILYGEEDLKEGIRFDCLNIENVVVLNDAAGRVNHAYIEYEFDAEQAIGKLGPAVGQKVQECYAKGDYTTKFKYLFCITPRSVYDGSKRDAKNMPYAALWVDRQTRNVVRESGFREFPLFVSRFAKSKGSPYGYSPEMNVYADIKMLQQMDKANILGAQMSVLPPKEVPDEAFMRPYNFNPNGINIKNAGYPNEHIVPIHSGANVQIGLEFIERKERKIEQAFYNDLFLAIEQAGKMTATEVNIRNNQRMQMLGSAIGNIMREKLSPVIGRCFQIAARNNMLPKIPPDLMTEEYIIEYISPLARAQKALELNNINDAMAIIASFATVSPDVLDKIDFDNLIDEVAEITNVSPSIIRDDAEVEELRAARAEQQAMAQQMTALQQGTEMVKTGAEADRTIAEARMAGVK